MKIRLIIVHAKMPGGIDGFDLTERFIQLSKQK